MSDGKVPMSALRLFGIAAIAGMAAGAIGLYVMGGPSGNNQPTVTASADAACQGREETLARLDTAIGGEVAAMLPADPSRPLGDLAFNDPDGQPMQLADLSGKVLLVNLWATWCAPCRHEMPALDELQREMGGEDFEVVAVNVETGDDAKPKAFLDEIGVDALGFYRDNTVGLFNELKRRNLALGLPVTLEPDGMRRNDAGELLRVEFLNDSQSFERIIAPYVENLRRLGVDAVQTRIDNAQMEARTRPPSYDMDIITGNARASLIPGADLKQFYGSETADVSAFNVMGLKSMAVDRLIEHVIAAESMESLTTAVHALDRVLRAERFWVPQWFKDSHTVAYFDMYEHPETLPPFAMGELDFWWYNPGKAAALRAAGVLR